MTMELSLFIILTIFLGSQMIMSVSRNSQ